jgi:hypothetical protein
MVPVYFCPFYYTLLTPANGIHKLLLIPERPYITQNGKNGGQILNRGQREYWDKA